MNGPAILASICKGIVFDIGGFDRNIKFETRRYFE